MLFRSRAETEFRHFLQWSNPSWSPDQVDEHIAARRVRGFYTLHLEAWRRQFAQMPKRTKKKGAIQAAAKKVIDSILEAPTDRKIKKTAREKSKPAKLRANPAKK